MGRGSRGHANGKLYCRKTNIESAAGPAEGESSRCLLFILGPTSVAGFLQEICKRIWLRFHVELCPPLSFSPYSLRTRSTKQPEQISFSFRYPKTRWDTSAGANIYAGWICSIWNSNCFKSCLFDIIFDRIIRFTHKFNVNWRIDKRVVYCNYTAILNSCKPKLDNFYMSILLHLCRV